ncbi:PilW family protein [uncultured Thiodictyon sp.]|uniref:PilW family protein n=1 Tax=uncultured Thiodictyon sp. TaxID=1846217 RepID=UPI0025D56FE8|nr:PilW family protein [uncultured Thiodictyon sp.]
MTERANPVSAPPPPAGWRPGFTLIELMIAIAIGLAMMLALLALFASSSRSNNEISKMNGLIENGRFAIQLLQSDLAVAGFWGTYLPQFSDLSPTSTPPDDVPMGVPDPCANYNNWGSSPNTDSTVNPPRDYKREIIGIPVQAYGYQATPAACTSVVTNQLANTDILVVRHAESCVPGTGNCDPDMTGKLYFQSKLCPTQLGSYVLSTTGGSTAFDRQDGHCNSALLADKRKFISHIYYVRTYAIEAPTTAKPTGDGIPTLVRSDFDCQVDATTNSCIANTLTHQAPIPLIEGIEGFRVELGIDNLSKTGGAINYGAAVDWQGTPPSPSNRGDGMPDSFVHCTSACTADQLMNVTAVKLYILVRAREPTPGYKDGKFYRLGTANTLCAKLLPTMTSCNLDPRYKRHVFSTTIRLNNVSFRRETP